ncbi:MAG: protein kinase domain-containing protein [Planctomycetota bacterium]
MISPARCHYSELLLDYLDATIDDHTASAIESHLNSCEDCLALLRENSPDSPSEAWLQLLQNPFAGISLLDTPAVTPQAAVSPEFQTPQVQPPSAITQTPPPTPPGAPASGLRYTCTRHLGSGGSGEVWEAWDQLLGRSVALKFLKNSTAPLDDTHRLMQEATALARLSHPHIVTIHELQNFNGQPALVMELVPGPSLAHCIRGCPCPPTAAAVLLEQLCQAIHHAHALGVVHRDLKPSNVLLKPLPGLSADTSDSPPQLANWCPKVADFGLAHIPDQPTLTRPGQRLGTPGYMAPEQVSADAQSCGSATDIYGLGAILYELLTGRPPFVSTDPAITMTLILREDPVAPRTLVSGIPRDLENICLKCLQKEPHSRYDTVQALREDCLAFLQNRPISARPVSRPRKVLKWARRHPAEATAVFTSVALLMAITAGLLRNAQLSKKLSAEAVEKIRLLEETQSLQRQQQQSMHSKFDQLLQTHYRFLQMLGDPAHPQPVDQQALRTEIQRSAAELSVPYIEMLDQKIRTNQVLAAAEVRLAVDYLDLAFRAGAPVDFSTRLGELNRLIENLPPQAAPPRHLLEIKIRLQSLNARLAAGQNQHLKAAQCQEKMATLIDQQLLTFRPDDPARVERLYMKTGMLLNATMEYIIANRRDLALKAALLAEESTALLITTEPANQNWLALLLDVRLRHVEILPPQEAADLASSTLAEFLNTRWDAPHHAEKARQIQTQLQTRLIPPSPG